MLRTFKCPHCGRMLDTDHRFGVTVPCPHCDQPFELAPSRLAGSGGLYKVLVPIGYVLFVAVPLVLTIVFVMNRAERVQREEDEAARVAALQEAEREREREREREKERERAKPRPPRDDKPKPPRKKPDEPKPDDVSPAKPVVEVPPKPAKPKGDPPPVRPVVEYAVAPGPREVPLIDVAPEPRRIVWAIPKGTFEGPWQPFDGVDLRVANVVLTKVPLVNGQGAERESPGPALVVVVEARARGAAKKRVLKSWTFGREHYFAGFFANGAVLPFFDTALGTKVNTGVPVAQPLDPNGTPARDVIVFAPPPAGAGELSLRLDGDRVGETKDLWLKVPESAWK